MVLNYQAFLIGDCKTYIVILMYKVKYRLVPDFICDIFSTKSCKYNFRNQNFDIPRFNSVLYGKRSLRYLGPFLWNKLLDKNITETSSLSRFKFQRILLD